VTAARENAVAGKCLEVEARVAEAVARRDFESAATALIEGYGSQVLGYLRAVVKDGEEAEDAFALFAENVWRGFPTWEGRASARAWAYSVAWNAAGRMFRDPWHRRRRKLQKSVASKLAAAVLSSSRLDLERREAGLERLRAVLTPEEQSLLVLRVDRELSWREVAVAMGEPDEEASLAALRKRFERLKAKLAITARTCGLLGES
jgi:RNA polymerase sigma-70 factor (ECF subfamily)